MAGPLESSRRKFARAKEHIADLKREIDAFNRERPYAALVEPDPEKPEQEVHKLKVLRPIPDRLTSVAADAISNLRSALDAAGYDIARATGVAVPKYCAFPFAGGKTEFENSIRGRCKDIPEEIRGLLGRFQPYRGGNDFFWALNDVAVRDKHTLFTLALDTQLGDFSGSGGLIYLLPHPTLDRVKQEVEFARFAAGHDAKYEADFAFCITFDEIPVVAGEPVLRVLDYFVSIVESVLGAIEAEARRLKIIT